MNREHILKQIKKYPEDLEIVDENPKYILAKVLTYKGAVLATSRDIGGSLGRWAPGWRESDKYWKLYTEDRGSSFIVAVEIAPKADSKKYMIEMTKDEKIHIYDQADKDMTDQFNTKYERLVKCFAMGYAKRPGLKKLHEDESNRSMTVDNSFALCLKDVFSDKDSLVETPEELEEYAEDNSDYFDRQNYIYYSKSLNSIADIFTSFFNNYHPMDVPIGPNIICGLSTPASGPKRKQAVKNRKDMFDSFKAYSDSLDEGLTPKHLWELLNDKEYGFGKDANEVWEILVGDNFTKNDEYDEEGELIDVPAYMGWC